MISHVAIESIELVDGQMFFRFLYFQLPDVPSSGYRTTVATW